MLDFLPFIASNLWARLKVVTLPVFEPNEYFFEHHAKDGEEKWQTFARVIRQIMSDHSHLGLSDFEIEDKYTYKRILFPKRTATD